MGTIVTACDNEGETPLHIAARLESNFERRRDLMCDLLARRDISVTLIRNKDGNLASYYGKNQATKRFLQVGGPGIFTIFLPSTHLLTCPDDLIIYVGIPSNHGFGETLDHLSGVVDVGRGRSVQVFICSLCKRACCVCFMQSKERIAKGKAMSQAVAKPEVDAKVEEEAAAADDAMTSQEGPEEEEDEKALFSKKETPAARKQRIERILTDLSLNPEATLFDPKAAHKPKVPLPPPQKKKKKKNTPTQTHAGLYP
jgi:hypothetical protein